MRSESRNFVQRIFLTANMNEFSTGAFSYSKRLKDERGLLSGFYLHALLFQESCGLALNMHHDLCTVAISIGAGQSILDYSKAGWKIGRKLAINHTIFISDELEA